MQEKATSFAALRFEPPKAEWGIIMKNAGRIGYIVLCLLVCACVGKAPVLHESYRMANGAHRIPVTLNFDSGSGQYWGTYINEYYGDYRLGERNGHPTIYFDTINATRLNRPARLLNPEKAYFDFLYGEKMLSSDGDELVIRNFRGDYIRFKAVN